jgi:hypothetical protein
MTALIQGKAHLSTQRGRRSLAARVQGGLNLNATPMNADERRYARNAAPDFHRRLSALIGVQLLLNGL